MPSAAEPESNLAATHTRFVGRAAERARLTEWSDDDPHRVVLITGPAGVGKSRLALQAAHARLATRPDARALRVELAAARDGDDALRRIAAVLGLELGPGDDAVERIGDALAGRGELCLLLDDAEAVATALAEPVGHWLERAPDALVWITSRRELPPTLAHARIELSPLPADDAIELLVDRARAVRPDFVLPQRHRDDALALLSRLDGLPLAIELVAPRLRLLSVPQLAARFDRGEQGHALDAALARSWELLTAWERDALAQSAVFRDGFYLDAAEAVIDLGDHAEAPDLLTVLEGLVAQSLLRTTTLAGIPDEVRLCHLVSVQALARAKLPANSGAEARHLRYFLEQGTRWDAGIEGPDERVHTQRLMAELPNLEAAHESAHADPATRARVGLLLHLAYQRSGPFSRQRELCDGIVADATTAGDDALRAQGLLARARVARWAGETEAALQSLAEAKALAGEDAITLAGCLRNEAACHFRSGDVEAAGASIEAALEAARRSGRVSDRVNALNGIGHLWTVRGDHERAQRALEEALELARRQGVPGLIALVTSSLAELTLQRGRLDDAEAYSDEAITHYESLCYTRQLALELLMRARIRALSDAPGAREDAERALETTTRLGLRAAQTRATAWLGCIEFHSGDFRRAHGLLARALEETSAGERGAWLCYDAAARAALGDRAAARTRFDQAQALAVPACADLLEAFMAQDADARARAQALAEHALADEDPERGRVARTLLDHLGGHVPPRRRAPRVVLELSDDARLFRVASGAPVDLTRRRALRGILRALAEQHAREPGTALDLPTVLEAGWPGERMGADSGARRVYVTMNRLRKLGLGELVLTMGDGYMLAPEVEIVRP